MQENIVVNQNVNVLAADNKNIEIKRHGFNRVFLCVTYLNNM